MIPEKFILRWRQNAGWQLLNQVEQDLIISRALVDLYNDPHVKSVRQVRFGCIIRLIV